MKYVIALTGFLLAINGVSSAGLVDYDDYQADYYNDDPEYIYEDLSGEQVNKTVEAVEAVQRRNPKFVTTGKVMMLNEGGTIKLPCHVDELGTFMIIWKKGKDMIAIGDKLLRSDSRIQVESGLNGNSLIISLADASDAGQYVCQLNSPDSRTLTHTVNIRVPPSVYASPERQEVNAGESAVMKCKAERGEPEPQIYWTRKSRLFRSGESKLLGDTLELASVDRHDTGFYTCHGDNGWKHTANSTIQLQVLHKPEIEQHELFIHTHEGAEVEVTCIVHAAPLATVEWYRNGQLLDPTNSVISSRGNRHTLYITNIGTKNTHGKYMCRAYNNLGESSKVTVVSGVAKAVTFKSDRMGTEADRFRLAWWTESNSMIDQFRIQYRPAAREGENWMTEFSTPVEGKVTKVDPNTFHGEIVLENLLSGTEYSVRVESKNIYGWSDHNQQFSFLTKQVNSEVPRPQIELKKKKKKHMEEEDLDDVTIDEPKPKYEPSVSTNMESAGSIPAVSSSLLLVLAMLLLFSRQL